MNALVKKEIRLILPAWALAMALAVFPVWLLWPGVNYGNIPPAPGVLVYGPFALGVLMLGLAPFGHELNYSTFSILLAQPVSRRRLWLTKTLVVGTALILVFVALCVSDVIRITSVTEHLKAADWQRAWNQMGTRTLVSRMMAGLYHDNLLSTLMYGGLSALAAFAGGLWTNLLFRNTSAAFWFTMLIPLGLGMLMQGVFGSVGVVGNTALVAALVLYFGAGFLWAKRYFLHVQDVQWTGGVISFPTWSRSSAAEGNIERKRRPVRALLWKEIQFQQANLLIAFLLLLTHLADIAVRKFAADYFLAHRQAAMIWESWPFLWLAMPFLIGAAAVAEERKLGTLETLLCLPTKRRREFIVKFATAIVLGVFLGGVMPVLVEWLGNLVGLHSNAGTLAVNWTMVSQARALLLESAALVVLAFYASTLTRNLLAALGLTVLWSATAYFLSGLVAAIGSVGYERIALWRGKLPFLTILPVMVAAVVWLSFANFKRLHIGSRLSLRNLFVLAAAFVVSAVVTTATYHRVWELWMPDEPVHHGPMIVAPSGKPGYPNMFAQTKIQTSDACIAAVLPDGRLWLQQGPVGVIERTVNGNHSVGFSEKSSLQSGFLGGTNWQEVATAGEESFAIQKDGTLWDLSEVIPGRGADNATRVGSDSDWKSISASENYFLALKTGGTLWMWGSLVTDTGTNLSIQRVSVPKQVGIDHDWIAVYGSPYRDIPSRDIGVVVKANGNLWRYGLARERLQNSWTNRILNEPEFWLYGPGGEPRSISFNWRALLLVLKDGSLWVSPEPARPDHEMVRWGNDSDWLDARLFGVQQATGIKRNHSLWLWNDFGWDGRSFGAEPTKVSRYQNWIAVCQGGNGFLTLAWDGSLCEWNLEAIFRGVRDWGYWSEKQLLAPSHIKARQIADLKR